MRSFNVSTFEISVQICSQLKAERRTDSFGSIILLFNIEMKMRVIGPMGDEKEKERESERQFIQMDHGQRFISVTGLPRACAHLHRPQRRRRRRWMKIGEHKPSSSHIVGAAYIIVVYIRMFARARCVCPGS